jgi:dihydropteroate synthase
MGPGIRITGRGCVTVTASGLLSDQLSLLEAFHRSQDPFERPAIGRPAPGTLSFSGTSLQLRRFAALLASDRRLPRQIASELGPLLERSLRSDFTLVLRGRTLHLGGRTHLMGVLNVTPDSFSDGGMFADPGLAVEHARAMAAQGADIIDIGGESTRPGAEPLSDEEELRRIIPVIERVAAETGIPVSVDTYKANVAARALAAGASIVNDISGLRFSPDMARVVADHGAAVVIMHIKGTPRDMQANPVYEDLLGEIIEYLAGGVETALRAGVPRDRILVDPGIGFGKTVEHNLTIIARLDELRVLGCPVVLGTSRKRFIGAVLDAPDPKERREGTAATVALGIERGAHIVRVHDVAEMAKVARMTDAIVKNRIEY